MQKLNNAGQVLPNDWQVLPRDAAFDPEQLAVGKWLIPIKLYNANRTELSAKTNVSVWLDSDDEAAETADIVNLVPVIGVNFPIFTDGRGFSIGRAIRERYNFSGELRAIGNFMQDQLFYLKRCGFDTFVVMDEADVNSMAQSLKDFSDFYQGAVDDPSPLFRRRFGSTI